MRKLMFVVIVCGAFSISASVDQPQEVLQKARLLHANGMLAEAKKELVALIYQDNTPAEAKAEALLLLGDIALGERNFKGARENWELAIASYPNTPSAMAAKGRLEVLLELTRAQEADRRREAFETIRFASTVWDSRAEPAFRDAEGNEYVSTRGCRGELEVTATHLRFRDPSFCWRGHDLTIPFKSLEWISYQRWTRDMEVTIKLQSMNWTAKFSMPGTVSMRLLPHLAEESPSTRQHCGEMALNRNSSGTSEAVRTPVTCSDWLKD